MSSKIGSSFDVTTVVNELMKKESTQLKKMNTTEQSQEVKLSFFGQLSNTMQSLKKNFDNITTGFNTLSYTASSSDSSTVSASISSNDEMYPATHNLVITQLAKPETLASVNSFSTRSDSLALTGQITLNVGTNTYFIDIDATDTLDQIKGKINNASDNHDITASILTSTDGSGQNQYNLVISSNKTGVANKVTVNESLNTPFNFTNEVSSAQDAEFTFDGNNVIRSSNQIDDVIDGLSFSLSKTGSASITVSNSMTDRNNAIFSAIQNAVNSYNQVINFLNQTQADKNITDNTLSMIKMQLGNLIGTTLSGASNLNNLFSLGIGTAESTEIQSQKGMTFIASGTLEIDETTLRDVIANQPDDIQNFFTDDISGFLVQSDTVLDQMTNVGGLLANKTLWIKEDISRLDRSIGTEEQRLSEVRKQLVAKYAALSAVLDQFDNMSKFLDMQLDAIHTTLKTK